MSSGKFWVGVISGIVATALVALFAVPALGVFEMTATGKPGLLDWWGNTNWHNSVAWRAPDAEIPASADPEEGMEHYSSTCLVCHGAPSAPRAEWAQHMQPMPPELSEPGTQSFSDGELFHIIRGGVRMTGMPAFGPEHTDEDIWNMVAFVRQLNDLTDDQQQRLSEAAPQGHHGGGHHGDEHGHQKASAQPQNESGS